MIGPVGSHVEVRPSDRNWGRSRVGRHLGLDSYGAELLLPEVEARTRRENGQIPRILSTAFRPRCFHVLPAGNCLTLGWTLLSDAARAVYKAHGHPRDPLRADGASYFWPVPICRFGQLGNVSSALGLQLPPPQCRSCVSLSGCAHPGRAWAPPIAGAESREGRAAACSRALSSLGPSPPSSPFPGLAPS